MAPLCSFLVKLWSRRIDFNSFWVSQCLCQFILDLAGCCSTDLGSGRVFFSLFGVSQTVCQLVLGFASFLAAYSGSRRICFDLFCGSQIVCKLILDFAGFVSANVGLRRVFVSFCWVWQSFIQQILGRFVHGKFMNYEIQKR